MTEQVREIAIDDLVVSEFNPRKDAGNVAELAASIRERGVLEPILVTPVSGNGHFAIVAGSRRFAASKLAGKTSVPAIVREMSDDEAEAASLIENLHREDLSPLEEAQGYARWLEIKGKAGEKVTHDDLAKAVGKARPTVTNALRLLKAPKTLTDAMKGDLISAAHVRVALELKDISAAGDLTLRKGITVDELREQINDRNEDYESKGGGAFEAAKGALVEAQARHGAGGVTWREGSGEQIVNMAAALGKPPYAIAGRIGETASVSLAAHQKACTCKSWELRPELDYRKGGRGLKFVEQRVCIIASKYSKARSSQSPKAAGKKAKPLTEAQLAAQAKREQAAEEKREREKRARDEKDLTEQLTPRKAGKPGAAAAYTKLRKGTIPVLVARAVIYDAIFWSDDSQVSADLNGPGWARVVKMSKKAVSDLAASIIAERIESAFFPRWGSYSAEDGDLAAADGFGLQLPGRIKKKAAR